MDPKVHYTTQSSVYERIAVGFLPEPKNEKRKSKPVPVRPKPNRKERRKSSAKQLAWEILGLVCEDSTSKGGDSTTNYKTP